ncbi:hypothetical protein VRRI112168_07450 [Vreelandella rituensis]|uniref:Uncharacterized protein n=1 Tax=Vreelandella rituensis TaxID=2282306 RepID=A0A368TPA6_9GAMM|nr:hypothetical protein [Halomonas rituensis]RCV86136.1 hypothetical protein DU506_18970 [Halomonas rituensis]
MERVEDYIQGERVVRELRRHAPEALEALASDLEAPLSPPMERAVARSLDDERVADFASSQVMMPVMMKAFGVSAQELAEAQETLEARCEECTVKGRCWTAMRAGADADTARDFCPNAETFIVTR